MPTVLAFSEKQAKFVSEFLVDSNGTQAAIRDGYSASGARVTAHRLLTNDAIYGAIEAQRLADAARLSLGGKGGKGQLSHLAKNHAGLIFGCGQTARGSKVGNGRFDPQ